MSSEDIYLSDSDFDEKFTLPNFSSCFGILEFISAEDIATMKPLKCQLSSEEMEHYKKNEKAFNTGNIKEMDLNFEVERKMYAYHFYNFYINSCESIDDKNELKNQLLFLPELKERLKNPSKITISSADDYNSWIRVCLALKYIFRKEYEKLGLELFHTFSKLSDKYKEKECNKLWEKMEPEYGSIGHVFKYIKKEKIIPSLDRKELVKKNMKTNFSKKKK